MGSKGVPLGVPKGVPLVGITGSADSSSWVSIKESISNPPRFLVGLVVVGGVVRGILGVVVVRA